MEPSDQEEQEISRDDLRSELFVVLSSQFIAAIESDASLPSVARSAISDLLRTETFTSDDVINAVSQDNPESMEGING
jgi:hypothetical protein